MRRDGVEAVADRVAADFWPSFLGRGFDTSVGRAGEVYAFAAFVAAQSSYRR